MSGDCVLRPLRPDDAEAAAQVIFPAYLQMVAAMGRPAPPEPDPEQTARWLRLLERFPETDPDGCVLAEVDGAPAGVAVAIRRGSLWGLSLLFVDPDAQGTGVGRRLLEAAHRTAAGAAVEMILSSPDPRAIRGYARLGLGLHPAVGASGTVDRSSLPSGLTGRLGGMSDLDLVDFVDTRLRGSSRSDDVAALLDQGYHLEVVDEAGGRGYVVGRGGTPVVLGAIDQATARTLLWRCLSAAPGDAEVELHGLTAEQGWAVDVALSARLAVRPGGPLFLRGLDRPPGPYLPSGVFF